MRELISGLLLGALLIFGGIALFRFRKSIARHNEELRAPMLGPFITRGMAFGDRMTFPVLAVVLCLAGLALIVWTFSRAVSGH